MGHWCRRRRRCSPPPPPSPGRTPLEMSVYPGDGWPPSPSPSPPPPSAGSARIDFSPLPCFALSIKWHLMLLFSSDSSIPFSFYIFCRDLPARRFPRTGCCTATRRTSGRPAPAAGRPGCSRPDHTRGTTSAKQVGTEKNPHSPKNSPFVIFLFLKPPACLQPF